MTTTSSTASWADRILRVLDHVHAHLDDELEPDALAALAGFSRHHFHRVFRGMVGESVMGHVRRLRLERAAFRLRHAGGEILPLALAYGYDSHEAFTRAFRAHFGLPPSEYRDAHRAEPGRLVAERRREPGRRVLAHRFVGPYDGCGAAWAALMAEVERRGLPPAGPPLGLVWDDPEITPPERCRYDACWPLGPGTPGEGPPHAGFSVREIPGGTYAVARHVGPYDGMLDTYVALLGRWLPAQGAELADDPVVEIYLDAPGSVPDAALRTDVCVRLA